MRHEHGESVGELRGRDVELRMLEFFKKMLGHAPRSGEHSSPVPSSTNDEEDYWSSSGGSTRSALTDRYFALSAMIERAKVDGNYAAAATAARETYRILPTLVDEWVSEYGSWDIQTCHAVHTGASILAVMGDREGLRELREVLEKTPELRQWLHIVDQADAETDLVERTLAAVRTDAGIIQTRLKTIVRAPDARRLATIVSWLERSGRIQRVKTGGTYRLFQVGHEVASSRALHENPPPHSDANATLGAAIPEIRRRAKRAGAQATHITLAGCPYVRLPSAPAHWEERQRQQAPDANVPSGESTARTKARVEARFTVHGEGWSVRAQEKLMIADRPDPAYKIGLLTSRSTFWLDLKGRRDGFEQSPAVVRVTNDSGDVISESGLPFDIYRSDANADGSAAIFLSRGGILHAYSDSLEPLLAEKLEEAPEYAAQASRLGIDARELKNHVRCVAISNDKSCYLVTVVDEAWCLSVRTGTVIWGVRFPTQEGWTRVATPRSERTGTSDDVDRALELMGIHLPATPADVTKQYRRLASRWHPDRNPGDASAVGRMQDLNAAMETLTGIDLGGMEASELEHVSYEKVLHRERYGGLDLTFSMSVGEKQAADWIYAANFASTDNRVYLAGYSGKVIEFAAEGRPLRVYDIGSVPRQIVETSRHLYILTDTRLYVLDGDRLIALHDVFDQGRLIVGNSGFGLLETKAFSWHTPTGERVGGVQTKDPIRRVFRTNAGLIVETRQNRAIIVGAPHWWEG